MGDFCFCYMYVCMYWAVLENVFLRESNRQEKKLRNAMILDSLHQKLQPAAKASCFLGSQSMSRGLFCWVISAVVLQALS